MIVLLAVCGSRPKGVCWTPIFVTNALHHGLVWSYHITNNANFIPNYGERYRHGERISTGFVESTVNQVVSKRMVKKQQMRWSQRGAHLLLQIRTRVLNGDWEATFRRWYPGFHAHTTPVAA